ncbi:MAG: alanine--glyoxylate aminotransferase family protein [Leptospiraceae bacterium]|nr:alanine--glyoxylate aminotransferase family protein [Leptospiraceae bacterium]
MHNQGLSSYHPPERLLLGPGPTNMDARVLAALSRPVIGHLDPSFQEFMEDLKTKLRVVFQTNNAMTLPISAPGSAGMELCLRNLLSPGDTAIICVNGVFGQRMCENVRRADAVCITVEDDWGRPIDPQKLEDTLRKHPEARLVGCVHAETSTGVGSDVRTLASIAHQYDCMIVVDAVTSLGGMELRVDDWELDAVYSGSQKCLGCTPGLSPVTLNERALHYIRNRSEPVRSWFLDVNLLSGYWQPDQRRSYHHTAPVHTLFALHEACILLLNEGLENAWERHAAAHRMLKAALDRCGMEFAVAAECRLPQLNAVRIPDGVNDAEGRARLLQDFNIEVGAGLGVLAGKIWRVGLMGPNACRASIDRLLPALQSLLPG